MKKAGRYGKYGEQKRIQRLKVKRLSKSSYENNKRETERWRKKEDT